MGIKILFLTGIIVVIFFTICMVKAAVHKPTGEETLIVLGCRVYGETPSLSLKERLDAAYEYLTEHPETACIVSGGKGDGENISEAEAMYRYLIKKGIHEKRIYRENKSTTTRENLEFSKKIIEENQLSEKIAIATNEYHQYRVFLITRRMGMENTAVSGKTAWWLLPTFYVRELYGILYQLLY